MHSMIHITKNINIKSETHRYKMNGRIEEDRMMYVKNFIDNKYELSEF